MSATLIFSICPPRSSCAQIMAISNQIIQSPVTQLAKFHCKLFPLAYEEVKKLVKNSTVFLLELPVHGEHNFLEVYLIRFNNGFNISLKT